MIGFYRAGNVGRVDVERIEMSTDSSERREGLGCRSSRLEDGIFYRDGRTGGTMGGYVRHRA
jgi:hypothetical protein